MSLPSRGIDEREIEVIRSKAASSPKKSTCPQSLHSVAPTGNGTRDLLIANPTLNSPNSFCVFCQRAARIMHRSLNTREHAIPTLFSGKKIPQIAPYHGGSMVTWAHRTPHAKRHLDGASRLFRAHAPLSLYFTMGRPLPYPKIALSPGGGVQTPI